MYKNSSILLLTMTSKKNKSITGANVRFQPSDHRQSRKSQAEIDSVSNRRPLIPALLTVSLITVICSLCYRGYLDTHYAVNSPFRGPKVTKKESDPVIWGTFRPGQYLGLRTKEPKDLGSVNAGLMWYINDELLSKGPDAIRYDCENRGDIKYGYVEHDTSNYGLQVIEELNENSGEVKFRINTTFLRPDLGNKKDWTVRVNYENKILKKNVISFIWYTMVDPGDDIEKSFGSDYELQLEKLLSEHVLAKIKGQTPSLGDFKMSVIFDDENINNLKSSFHISVGRTHCNAMADLKKCLIQGSMTIETQKSNHVQHHVVLTEKKESSGIKNLVAVQITLYSQTGSFDIVYQQNQNLDPYLTGKKFTELASLYSTKFHEKFNRIFKLENYSQEYNLFALSTFSQMAGSIGYFYGNSLVKDGELSQSNDDSVILRYWKSPLLTSVPSRSQFPRGFLWDDGFHGLLLSKWSTDLELDIVGHWLDTMNCRGWIPREQILGSEARARVPSEFIVQSSTAANPPALLLTIESILDKLEDRGRYREENYLKHREILNRMWPRLRAWYSYFNDTQGAHKYSNDEFPGFKWYGRDSKSQYELNPKTLTCGMDDYPRSSHPENSQLSNDKKFERHLDLFCWMSRATRIMYRLGTYLNLENKEDLEAIENYREFYQVLVSNLDRLHWSDTSSIYADYGLHTEKVELRRTQKRDGTFEFKRFVLEEPKWLYVDKHPGYNSLFPLLMRIVPSKERLNSILDLIESDLLTKSCGLRSLSKRSNIYNKYNTEHDPPYWRGQVWININFLTLGSLNYYMGDNVNIFDLNDPIDIDKETRLRCREIYNKLRNDVINCIFLEWKRTGYVWERYSDNLEEVWDRNIKNNGKQKSKLVHKGIGTRPFTGWSATVVLMMAELY